ncbi:MAG TPA: hypothetical protein DHV12_09345 [Thermotogae bacterium]|nr:hypothetical protein [Thermotogota bacterium]
MVKLKSRWSVRLPLWIVVCIFCSYIVLALSYVIVGSFSKQWFTTYLPVKYTLEWYRRVFKMYDVWEGLINSLIIGLSVVGISLAVGFMGAYTIVRKRPLGVTTLRALLMFPIALPVIAYGIPLAALFYRFGIAGGLHAAILAHLIPCLPYAVLMLIPFIEQIPEELEIASLVLGESRLRTFLKVVIPLSKRGLLAAGINVFLRSYSEFVLSYLVLSPENPTLQMVVFSAIAGPGYRPMGSVNALVVVLMIPTFALLTLTLMLVRTEGLSMGIGQ